MKDLKVSCYVWDDKEGVPEDFSVKWGIVEGKEKVVVKFVIEFDSKKIAFWISDLTSVLTIQKMISDYLHMRNVREIEQKIPGIVADVNEIMAVLRRANVEHKRFEVVVKELCQSWSLTSEQTDNVIALAICIAKLVEELFKERGGLIPYIY